ncbi:MAG: hypothetical protein COB99_08385 [Sulfurimonas sp.]|nr:MAG: hypothetical protein COB99_08385 [Sulfurimonas sp.]
MLITVKAWGDTVAKLKHKDGIYIFSLSPENKLNFSPIKLPTKAKAYEFSHLKFQNGLPGLINDSLPGVYGKEYLDEFFMKHFKFKPTHLESLQFLGENTMGALTYEPELKDVKVNRANAILEAKELYQETKKALLGDADFSINEIIAISNSAASGARPKAIVGFNPVSKKMFVGSKYESLPEGYIHSMVKFDNLIYKSAIAGISELEKASQTKGEYIYSLLAKESGIKMANTHLVEDDDGHCHFITERFDIKSVHDTIVRKHMHSLSGLMHQNPAETTFDYTNLFRVGDRLNIPYEDKEQFFKTMVFNLIFGNRDDHTRNFSYLMDSHGKWRGAPAYDLTFSTNKSHQMLFDFKDAKELTSKDVQKIAESFDIKNAKQTMEEMLDVKHTLLPKLATQYDMKKWANVVLESTKYVLDR